MTLVFETERLLIRHWEEEDAPTLLEIYQDPEVNRFLGRVAQSLEEQKERLSAVKARYREDGDRCGFWAIIVKDTGEVAGAIMLKPLPGHEEIEIGWHLRRSAWGAGYATEAGRGCLQYACERLGLTRIVAVVNPLNTRSLAVARRLGMTPEGTVVAYEQELALFALERALQGL